MSETVVRRMLDPKHDTKPDRIQAALTALGKRIVVVFEDAAWHVFLSHDVRGGQGRNRDSLNFG
jgi:hypothetical protein